MNDAELFTVVREQRNKIQMTTPLEQVIRRGRALRARRRIPGLAAVLAAVAAAVVAVAAQLPTSRQPGAQLAAWTVAKHADGTVHITIRELRDPAALQSTLRADGIPASVIFGDQPNVQPNPCQSYGHGGDPELLQKVVTLPTAPGPPREHSIAMTIHPSALPTAAGVQIIASPITVGVHLVTVSQACTGT